MQPIAYIKNRRGEILPPFFLAFYVILKLEKRLGAKMENIIELKSIKKEYIMKKRSLLVLDDLSISFEKGKFYAIMGHSGSGKSTLINIIGLLDQVTGGEYLLDGIDVSKMSDNDLARMRRDRIGFIFQDYFLDEYLKAYENVMYPMLINESIKKSEMKERAEKLLTEVYLEDRVEHFPKEMSGGEKQRVAIARALANDPVIIIADEPTGNLDCNTAYEIMQIFLDLKEKEGQSTILVTHDPAIASYADRILFLQDGRIYGEYKKQDGKGNVDEILNEFRESQKEARIKRNLQN